MKLPRNSRKENVEGLPQNTKVFKYNIHWKINLKYIHTLSSNNDNKFYETFLKKLFFIKQTNAWIEKFKNIWFGYNVKLLFQQNTICIQNHQHASTDRSFFVIDRVNNHRFDNNNVHILTEFDSRGIHFKFDLFVHS